MKLGTIIFQYRSKQGLTLEQLSNKSNLSRSYLSKIENGGLDNGNASLSTIIKLATGLGIKVREILELLDVSEPRGQENAIPLNVYLRKKYDISKDRDIKIIENLIDHLKEK